MINNNLAFMAHCWHYMFYKLIVKKNNNEQEIYLFIVGFNGFYKLFVP